jgi:hypothetical protein
MLLVKTVGRRVYNRIDRGILEDGVEIVAQIYLPVTTKVLRLAACARVAGDEGDLIALALDAVDKQPSPPAKTDDCSSNHVSSVFVGIAGIRSR